jgi:hypothetical protein
MFGVDIAYDIVSKTIPAHRAGADRAYVAAGTAWRLASLAPDDRPQPLKSAGNLALSAVAGGPVVIHAD